MRAPRDLGDKLVISSVADASPKPYPLARIPNNVSYETVSEQPEAEPNQPLVVPLTFHGGLAYSNYNPQSAGYVVSNGITLNEPNVIRAPTLNTNVSLTGAANPPNYFFETTVNDAGADDGQPVLYVIANESGEVNVYKISLDSGDFGTLLNTKTFTVTTTQPSGQPAEWNDGSNTRWYLGLGDNGKIQRLDSVVSGTSADTWTASSDADARHLKVVGNQLVRSTNENQVSILPRAGDPNTEASWGGDFFVGDASAKITELGEAGGLGYIAKEDGFYEWDLVGEAENIFPEISQAVRNGQGMVYWHGGFLIPAESGLWWTRTGKPTGPDSNPQNRGNHPSLGNQAYFRHGRWMGQAPFGGYIYGLYVSSFGTTVIVAWGRERDESDPRGWGPLVWHGLEITSGDFNDFHGIYVAQTSEFSSTEVRPTLWYSSGNDIRYIFLDKDGSPMARRGDVDLAADGALFTGDITAGVPRVLKQLHAIEGWAENFAASGHAFQFIAYLDGGTSNNIDDEVNTNGFFRKFWTQDTNDTARAMIVALDWNGTGNLTDTNGPLLRDVVLRLVALPKITREWTFLLKVEDEPSRTAKKIRSELEGYVGDLKKYELPDGDTFNGVMGKVRMLRADEINALMPRNQEPPHYVMAAPVREVSGS